MMKNTGDISLLAQGYVLYLFGNDFVKQLHDNPSQSLSSFYSSFLTKISVEKIEGKTVIKTPGALLSSLYMLIVFPQQRLKLKNGNKEFNPDELGTPEIDWKEKTPTLAMFIKKIRNSISHGRISFDDQMKVTFEDGKVTKNGGFVVDFKIKISIEDLDKFTARLGREWELDS